jgi:hypothetical protein
MPLRQVLAAARELFATGRFRIGGDRYIAEPYYHGSTDFAPARVQDNPRPDRRRLERR